MLRRLKIVGEFVCTYAQYIIYVREVIALQLVLIVLGGVAYFRVEDIDVGDAMYFAFVTGLTIGYGDITPETAVGKVVSVAIGLVGTLFVGLTVAVATHALSDTASKYIGHRRHRTERGTPGGEDKI